MSEQEERAAAESARESAGWNSPPSVPIWAVSPDLHMCFDEVYFETLEEAIDYIAEHVGEKISTDYTEADLAKDGFTLRLWRKLISQEMHDTIFLHREWVDAADPGTTRAE